MTDDLDLEQRFERLLPSVVRRHLERLDGAVSGFMEAYGVTLLRLAIALVFIWFGALKLLDRSPVEDLVKDTVYFLPEDAAFFMLGALEIIVGLGLLFPVALRLTLILFWSQMAGTFLVLIVHPSHFFQDDNPLYLTTTGEFIIKNLVLIAAGLVIGSTVRRLRSQRTSPHTS